MASQHALNGRIGGLESWSRTKDRTARTQAARERSPACVEYHIARVSEEITDPDQRRLSGEAAHRAYMLRQAAASAAKRRRRTA